LNSQSIIDRTGIKLLSSFVNEISGVDDDGLRLSK
jgi:hypothetical protein